MKKFYNILKQKGISLQQEELIKREMNGKTEHPPLPDPASDEIIIPGFYGNTDLEALQDIKNPLPTGRQADKPEILSLQTLDDLLARDKQREADGFPRRIRIGKYIKPSKDNKEKVVVVPTTTEPKFYHDDSVTEEESTGGSGDGEEGEVIAEEQAEPQEGEGEGQGAGQGEGAEHEIGSDAFDLGKILTEKFQLPNLKVKGTKVSQTKFIYDLTDKNRGFGQVLDKKATLKKIIDTNIQLGNLSEHSEINPEDLVINPQDLVYRILSKEKDYEAQCVVFFIRDYSGSMQGKPTEVVVSQHLLIYSWLMYQYQNNVTARFILHDTESKEAPDFHTYYKSQVAGGTNISPAYELVNKIVAEERLVKDNNIYVFHGTDGDDWEEDGSKAVDALKQMMTYINRIGITIAKNSWTSVDTETVVEKYMDNSNLLKEKSTLIRLDVMVAEEANEGRIIDGIKKLISE